MDGMPSNLSASRLAMLAGQAADMFDTLLQSVDEIELRFNEIEEVRYGALMTLMVLNAAKMSDAIDMALILHQQPLLKAPFFEPQSFDPDSLAEQARDYIGDLKVKLEGLQTTLRTQLSTANQDDELITDDELMSSLETLLDNGFADEG